MRGRALLLLALMAGAPGCVTTTLLTHPGQIHASEDQPGRLQVQVAGDTTWLPVTQYRTTQDSLFGNIEGSSQPGTPLRRLELPFDSVTAIRVQRMDPARTAAIPVVTGIVVAMAAWILVSP